MFAICVEASHGKGMGHLFRMLNFIEILRIKKQEFVFVINDDKKVKEILIEKEIIFETIDFNNSNLNWEYSIIKKYAIKYWINDRLQTNIKHAQNIHSQQVKLITFDDSGNGANSSDINICGLLAKDIIKGKKVLSGIEYLILNSELNKFRRQRTDFQNIIVSLGGSDTYNVTLKILKLLKKYKIKATIHIGPGFKDIKVLKNNLTEDYKLISHIPSLIEELNKYDLAITGGGITPFEANALGLPCLIVANEEHEIYNAQILENFNSSIFVGFYKNINEEYFKNISSLDIESMSTNGLKNLTTNAANEIYEEILCL